MTEKQENDVFYVCSLIEHIARKTKNHRQDACLNIVFAPIANKQSAYKKEARRPKPSCFFFVWASQDLNPGPSGYENVANFEIPFFL